MKTLHEQLNDLMTLRTVDRVLVRHGREEACEEADTIVIHFSGSPSVTLTIGVTPCIDDGAILTFDVATVTTTVERLG